MLAKRSYRDGVELSIVGLGGIVLIGHEQADADRIVAESVERGVNYFDVAPSYGGGEAQRKLGLGLRPYRNSVFLTCKTLCRDASGAAAELAQSLRELHTDHLDLYQFHCLQSMDDVEQITARGGALETFHAAQHAGQVRFIGLSAHDEEAAIALMDRVELASVLFPINYVCWQQGGFGPRLFEAARKRGVARLALKAIAHGPVKQRSGQRKYPKAWHEPIDEPARMELALRFTLSQDITAAVPPGTYSLHKQCLEAAERFTPLSSEETQQLLDSSAGLTPLFPTT